MSDICGPFSTAPKYSVFDPCEAPESADTFFDDAHYAQVPEDLARLMHSGEFSTPDERWAFLHELNATFHQSFDAVMADHVIAVIESWEERSPGLGGQIMNGLIDRWSKDQIVQWGKGESYGFGLNSEVSRDAHIARLATPERLAKLATAWVDGGSSSTAERLREAIAVRTPAKLDAFDEQMLIRPNAWRMYRDEDAPGISMEVLQKGLAQPELGSEFWRNAVYAPLGGKALMAVASSDAFKKDLQHPNRLPELDRFNSALQGALSVRHELSNPDLLQLADQFGAGKEMVKDAASALRDGVSLKTRSDLAMALKCVVPGTLNLTIKYEAPDDLQAWVNRLPAADLVRYVGEGSLPLRFAAVAMEKSKEPMDGATLTQWAQLTAHHLPIWTSTVDGLPQYSDLETLGKVIDNQRGLSPVARQQAVNAAVTEIAAQGAPALNAWQLSFMRKALSAEGQAFVDNAVHSPPLQNVSIPNYDHQVNKANVAAQDAAMRDEILQGPPFNQKPR